MLSTGSCDYRVKVEGERKEINKQHGPARLNFFVDKNVVSHVVQLVTSVLNNLFIFRCPGDLDVEPSKLCAVHLLDAQKYFAVNLDAQTMFDPFTQGPIDIMSCHHWQISKSHLHRLAYRPRYPMSI